MSISVPREKAARTLTTNTTAMNANTLRETPQLRARREREGSHAVIRRDALRALDDSNSIAKREREGGKRFSRQ
jgi:hypothetical protein